MVLTTMIFGWLTAFASAFAAAFALRRPIWLPWHLLRGWLRLTGLPSLGAAGPVSRLPPPPSLRFGVGSIWCEILKTMTFYWFFDFGRGRPFKPPKLQKRAHPHKRPHAIPPFVIFSPSLPPSVSCFLGASKHRTHCLWLTKAQAPGHFARVRTS